MRRKGLLVLSVVIGLGFLCYFFFHQKSYHTCLNVNFSECNVPITNVEIEGRKYYLEIDTGSKFALTLDVNSLAKIKGKKKLSDLSWKDFKGNAYSSGSYQLPKVALADIFVTNVVTRTNNRNYNRNVMLFGTVEKELEHVQSIGRPFLDKFKLLLDFRNSRMFISNDLKKLKEFGFDIGNFKKIPIEIGITGAIVKVETDFGIKRLAIDTGTTVTAIRKMDQLKVDKSKRGLPVTMTKKFVIGGKNFGSRELYLLDITTELKAIDGILGMDFLKSHVMYIDFPGKAVYIE